VAGERARARADDPRPSGRARQLWARLRAEQGGLWVEGAGWWRALSGEARAPTAAAEARAGARAGRLAAWAEGRWASGLGVAATAWRLAARGGGRWAVTADLEGGRTWLLRAGGGVAPPIVRAVPSVGWRVGLEGGARRGDVALAWVQARVDSVVPFGLVGDTAAPALRGATVRTVEALGHLRLRGGFALEARGTAALGVAPPPAGPRAEMRGALVYHRLHYTGNLEPRLWAEVRWRGPGRVPAVPAAPRWVDQPGYVAVAVGGVVRIIDVHVHAELENIRNDPAVADLPQRPLGARAIVGVRWVFRN